MPKKKIYKLTGPDGQTYESNIPGTIGGYKPGKIFGRLDCPSAKKWIARGFYTNHRVFFIDEATARKAGFRPCGICMQQAYSAWKIESKAISSSTKKRPRSLNR